MDRASLSALLSGCVAVTAFAVPMGAYATDYKVYGNWQIMLTDANSVINACAGSAIREDYFVNGTLTSPDPWMLAYTRYAELSLQKTVSGVNYFQAKFADANGCATFTGFPSQSQMTNAIVTVNTKWYYAADDVLVVHGPDDDFDNSYGYSEFISPVATPTTNTIYVGSSTARATLAASAGFSAYRGRGDVEHATMRIVECGFDGCSSAHYDSSGLSTGIARVRIYDGSDTDVDHRNRKFLVSHEMGHAWALLRTKRFEAVNDDFFGMACLQPCYDFSIDGYSMNNAEYNSIGSREAYAHFYGARVWNDVTQGTGVFTWIDGVPYDLECFRDGGGSWNPIGGRIVNDCDGPSSCRPGKSINEDWMRFFWDLHTPYGSGKFSASQLVDIYEYTQRHGFAPPDGILPTYTLTIQNYQDALRNAMVQVTNNDATLVALWDERADANGVTP